MAVITIHQDFSRPTMMGAGSWVQTQTSWLFDTETFGVTSDTTSVWGGEERDFEGEPASFEPNIVFYSYCSESTLVEFYHLGGGTVETKKIPNHSYCVVNSPVVYYGEQEYTASCPKNYSGEVVRIVRTAESSVSQEEADKFALEAAMEEATSLLVCTISLEFEDIEVESRSFTASYSVSGEFWAFEHDYVPNMYLSSDKRIAAFDKGTLYLMNDKNSKGKYFDGIIYESTIDVPFSPGGDVTAILHSLSWITEVTKEDATIHDQTVHEVLVYNNEMCSGYVELKNFKGLRDAEGTWRFNKFKNLVNNRNLPIMIKNEPNESNLGRGKAWFKKDIFIGKYFIVRYKHRNNDQNNLYIYDVDCIVRKSDR